MFNFENKSWSTENLAWKQAQKSQEVFLFDRFWLKELKKYLFNLNSEILHSNKSIEKSNYLDCITERGSASFNQK